MASNIQRATMLVEGGLALLTNPDKVEHAENLFRMALELNPDNPSALHNLGTLLCKTRRAGECVPLLTRAAGLSPQSGKTWGMLAMAYKQLDRIQDSIICGTVATALPGDDAYYSEIWHNLAGAYELAGDYSKCEAAYDKTLRYKEDPYSRAAWGMIKMLRGDFMYGLPMYESRLQMPNVEDMKTSVLTKEDNPSLIVVYSEQGVGDLFQMMRYIPMLRKQWPKADVVLRCPQPLIGIMERFALFDEVKERYAPISRDAAIVDGAKISAMSLMYTSQLLGEGLYQPQISPISMLPKPELKNKIGICWKGNPAHPLDKYRSIPDDVIKPLLATGKFVNLQTGGLTRPDLIRCLEIHDISTWEKTLAVINACDSIVTVDTAVAHLAGCLGKPVKLLISAVPDWRWGLEKETAPWYRNMVLFRQKQLLNWAPVLEEIEKGLA